MNGIVEDLMGRIEFPIHQGGPAYLQQQQDQMRRQLSWSSWKGRGVSKSASNLWRIAHGSNSAVLKKIYRGGTHTANQLGNQLDYLFGKASALFGNMVDLDPHARTLTTDQRQTIVEQWSDEWTGDPKNGHTTHLLISFPWDVGARRVTPIVEQWCAEMFQSGRYVEGEEWAYVAALHTDRVNPHVHIVVNNRGVVDDTWFYMAKGHAFDLDTMKERLVEIAADHGMYLDSSSRLDRGVLTYGPSRAEIERAAREGRQPIEKRRSGRALADALEKIGSNVRVMRQLASLATLISDEDLAQKIEAAAEVLEQGGIIHPRNMEIIMDAETIKTRGDLAVAYEKWLDSTEKDISLLPRDQQQEVRSEFYQIAAEISRDLGDERGAQLMHHSARTAIYQTKLEDDRISSLGADREIPSVTSRELESRIGALATEAGLDSREIRVRLSHGAANAWQEREWVKQDILDVANSKKIDLSTEEGRGRVAQIVDGFYDAAAKVISNAVQVEYSPQNDRLTRTLNGMADSLDKHGKVEFQNGDHAKRFGDDFRQRYGQDALDRIAEGDTDALAIDFPDDGRRRNVARAVVAATQKHQEIGLTLAQGRKAAERLAEQEAEAHEFGRSKDLDHEL